MGHGRLGLRLGLELGLPDWAVFASDVVAEDQDLSIVLGDYVLIVKRRPLLLECFEGSSRVRFLVKHPVAVVAGSSSSEALAANPLGSHGCGDMIAEIWLEEMWELMRVGEVEVVCG